MVNGYIKLEEYRRIKKYLVFSICLSLVLFVILIYSIVLYSKENQEITYIKNFAYFQAYLPKSGWKLIKNLTEYNNTCVVYRCYRLNNTMDCYITEGYNYNHTCYISGPTYGIVCRNNSKWNCYEMSTAKRNYFTNFMIPISYFDKITNKCCWLSGMKNGRPKYNCKNSSFLWCLFKFLNIKKVVKEENKTKNFTQ